MTLSTLCLLLLPLFPTLPPDSDYQLFVGGRHGGQVRSKDLLALCQQKLGVYHKGRLQMHVPETVWLELKLTDQTIRRWQMSNGKLPSAARKMMRQSLVTEVAFLVDKQQSVRFAVVDPEALAIR